jgi:hypothetical protein
VAAALGTLEPARIGLVPAVRPADVLALTGYNGTVNRYGTPEGLSAVLRSWEDRFGAMLLEVGFAHIKLLVLRPPRSQPAAEAAAAEIWAISDEFSTPDRRGMNEVSQIAAHIVGAPFWRLWLD